MSINLRILDSNILIMTDMFLYDKIIFYIPNRRNKKYCKGNPMYLQ